MTARVPWVLVVAVGLASSSGALASPATPSWDVGAAAAPAGGARDLWELLPHRVLHDEREGPAVTARVPSRSTILFHDDDGPWEQQRSAGREAARKMTNVAATACTTCSGLSFCTAGGMACWSGACIGAWGAAYREVEMVAVGAAGVVAGLILVAMTAAVFVPLGGALRYFGLWDTWTEQFIVDLWRIGMSVLF